MMAIAAHAAVALSASAALADGAVSPLCSQLAGLRQEAPLSLVAACHKALVNRVWLLDNAQDTRDYLIGRLVAGEAEAEPAGLTIDGAQARQRLTGAGDIVVVPTADATPAATRRWNVWIDGKYNWIDTAAAVADSDGPQINVIAGIDYKITDKFVFGLLGTFEYADLDSGIIPLLGTQTEGYGGGAYVGITLTDNLVYSGLVTGTFIDADIGNGVAFGSTDSERLSVTNGITGYWYFGQTRLSPSLTFAWQKEWQDAFIDSGAGLNPRQTLETGILTFGQVIGHTFALNNGMSVEPWIGANLDWTLINRVWIAGFGVLPTDETLDLRLQAGLNWTLAENVQLALTGEVSGFLLDDTDIYAGQANLAIQF